MKHQNASLHQTSKSSPHQYCALNKARLRARRNRIQAVLANGVIDDVERLMLEEEEAAIETSLAMADL